MMKTQDKQTLLSHASAIRLSSVHLEKAGSFIKELQAKTEPGTKEDILLGKFVCICLRQQMDLANLQDQIKLHVESL